MIVVKKYHNSGFSLVELITVIVLLGILGVIALGKLGSQDSFAARGFYEDTVNAVRFAQKLAISTGCDVQVDINTAADSYQIFQHAVDCTTGGFTRAVPNPANRGLAYQNTNIPTGFSLATNPGGGPTTITFNARGIRIEGFSGYRVTDGSNNFDFNVHTSGFVEALS
jgi:MSHA pilin protein MshC